MTEFTNKIQQILYDAAKREYIQKLRLLIKNVRYVLRTNPHNTFTGTAKQYIRKYSLHTELKYKIYNHYKIEEGIKA